MWSSIKFKSYSRRMALFLVIFLLIFTLSTVASSHTVTANSIIELPDQITLSWTDTPFTTQTIAWRSGEDTSSEYVQYLPATSYNDSFTDALKVPAVKTGLYPGYSHCEATLSQLLPDSEYIYRIGWEGAWSKPASFTTAACTDKFTFLYLGDVQKGYEDWGGMLKSIVTENPDLRFALLGGDLVNDGNSSDEWEQFFAAASPIFKQIPLLPAPGNHDDTPLFWNFFALPENGPEGFKEEFYSFDYGNCHIAVLNSNKMGASKPYYNTLKNWLQEDFDNSNQRWKFLMFHYPPYPVVYDGHSYNLEANWVPLFEQCGVDIVFVGHQHVYMRTKPLRDSQIQADGEGIVYIMGNSGRKFYSAGEDYDYIAIQRANVSNYQIINIDGDTFTLTSRSADGQEIDSYTLKKKSRDNPEYIIKPVTDTAYDIETTSGGIPVMTVNGGVSGMKYFSVELTPVKPHGGEKTVVFVHLRNGTQLSLVANQVDFDLVKVAQAGFNVQAGDTIKVYVVDNLTNVQDFNPIVQ